MSHLPPLLLAAVVATFFIAGIVKGVSGMGLPTVAMGILGGLISPLAAASLLIIPSLVTNVWQLVTGPAFGRISKRLWSMMLTVFVATVGCSRLITSGDTRLNRPTPFTSPFRRNR